MEIFVINSSDSKNISHDLLEKYKYKEFSNNTKLNEHCLSYLMLDRILKEVYHIENREIEFVNSKPYLKTKETFFSISHSKDYVAIAFSDSECGIDIEKTVERDFKAISERMDFQSTTLEEFYQNWTKYEAEYKLGIKGESIYQSNYDGYFITAVSSNSQETFELFIQNGEKFPNL